MAINRGMFTSKTDLWPTPQDFYDRLAAEFPFETDVCALPSNAKARNYYTPEIDGLKQTWTGVCYMNPPYGKAIPLWVQKAYESAINGATVVCLLPSRTDTRWFQDYCLKSSDIRFVKGRLRFGDGAHPAPFPSVVVVFSPETLGLTEGGSTIMKVEEMLTKSLDLAFKNAQLVTDPEKKATVFSKIALACATALKSKEDDEPWIGEIPKMLPKGMKTKDSLKTVEAKEVKNTSPTKKEQETVKTAPELPATEEKSKKAPKVEQTTKEEKHELTAEWDTYALEEMHNEITELQKYKEDIISKYGEEAFDTAIESATEGQYHTVDDISPLNIRLILAFIKERLATVEENDEEE